MLNNVLPYLQIDPSSQKISVFDFALFELETIIFKKKHIIIRRQNTTNLRDELKNVDMCYDNVNNFQQYYAGEGEIPLFILAGMIYVMRRVDLINEKYEKIRSIIITQHDDTVNLCVDFSW
jgi:hypothetical protein